MTASALPNINIQYDGQGRSTIYIAEATQRDAGWYQCTAYNEAGSNTTRGRLEVKIPRDYVIPPAPPTQPQFKLNIPHTGRIIAPT